MRERLKRVRVVDSHTGGEPTRIVVSGGPSLVAGTVAGRLEEFRLQHDYLRHALVNEPRGSEVVVGALLCEPSNSGSVAGGFFFYHIGFLWCWGSGIVRVVGEL